jgi:hypothetical protein
MYQLPIPPVLQHDPDAVEVARVWLGLGDLHVMLNVGMYRGADGPGELVAWGDILADTIRHVAHAIARQAGTDEQECLTSLLDRLRESLASAERPMDGGFKHLA